MSTNTIESVAAAAATAASYSATSWTLTSAALVLLMTPALALFYGGFVGERMTVNTMMMSL